MENEKLELMLFCGMTFLRIQDIKLGAMDANFEPHNHLLSAEENKRCWNYLAEQYVMNTFKNKTSIHFFDEFYNTWLSFLQTVEGVVRYGHKNKGIENIVNNSGISRETWVMFLD